MTKYPILSGFYTEPTGFNLRLIFQVVFKRHSKRTQKDTIHFHTLEKCNKIAIVDNFVEIKVVILMVFNSITFHFRLEKLSKHYLHKSPRRTDLFLVLLISYSMMSFNCEGFCWKMNGNSSRIIKSQVLFSSSSSGASITDE